MTSLGKTVATAAAALGLLLTGGTATQAAVPDVTTTIGVTGINGPLYSTPAAAPAAWTNLGGVLATAPTVVVSNGITHYMAVAVNGFLYHRTATTGWTRMAPDNFKCAYVNSYVEAGVITLGCTGLNRALYVASFDGSQSAPFLTGWTKAGGVIDGPAGGAPANGFFAIGGQYQFMADTNGDGTVDTPVLGNMYNWTAATGWTRFETWCDTAPAVSNSLSLFVFSCGWEYEDGSMTINIEQYSHDADKWYFAEIAGATREAPALSATGDGTTADLVVEGLNRRVYTKQLSWQNAGAPWTNLGGQVKFGVGAGSPYDDTYIMPTGIGVQSMTDLAVTAKPGRGKIG